MKPFSQRHILLIFFLVKLLITEHPQNFSFMKILIIRLFESLGVRVGLILGHLILGSLNLIKEMCFFGYSCLHKGFKCLDIPTGRVYISCDVIFDEGVFPFASLHENAGQRLRHEISLLLEHLLGSYLGGVDSTDRYYANDTDPNEHASVVIDEQEAAGDEYEPAEEVSIENRALGHAQQASGVQSLCDMPSVERGADSGGVTGTAAEPDTIRLGSGAGQLRLGQHLPGQRLLQSRARPTVVPSDRVRLGHVVLLNRTLRSRARQVLVEADSLRLQDQMRLLHLVNQRSNV
jgi:hypothetical protein